MSEQRPQSRGRARGRARGQPPAPGQQIRRPGDEQRTQQPPPGFQQQPQQQQQPGRVATRPPAQQQASGGRASHRVGPRGDTQPGDESLSARLKQMSVGPGGDGGNGGPVGRGGVRGRRQVNIEVIRTRPQHINTKKGSSGRPITLLANYFKLETHTNWCLYQYRVDFAPEEDITAVRKGLLRNHKETLGGYIFDGSMMFTSHRLSPDPMELFSQKQSDGTNVRITVRLVGDLAEGDFHYLQFFNILMRKALGHLKLQLVGRNFFDAKARVFVRDHKLELWPGYITSIRQHEEHILLCSEITHKIMRQDTVFNLLEECVNRSDREYRELFKSAIIGCVVLTDYNNQTYRIDDVEFESTPMSTFELRSGERITYHDYFLQKYQKKIRVMEQPMLVTRSKPRQRRAGQSELIYLVPELCRMTGLTDEMRANFSLMRSVAEHTRVGPDGRIARLNNFNMRLNQEQAIQDDLREWNMKLAQKLIECQARVLPPEKIVQGNRNQEIKYDVGPTFDWTKELRSNPLLVSPRLQNWVVISPNRLKRDAQSFVSMLMRAGGGMRFVIPQPNFMDIPDDRAGTFVEALERVSSAGLPQMVMCCVTNNRADRYSAIKKKCSVDRAIPSQVICAKNLSSKGAMSIATKVAIQMCCKIGGSPWSVEIPLSGLMVVGFDVCHDTTTKGKSYGAMVASLDKPFSRYFSAVSAHTSGEELSNHFTSNIAKALRKYQEFNGTLPQRILVYRDGVGEGQIPYVYTQEVEMLKAQLAKSYGQDQYKMAFIIVTKRINTRFFTMNKENPPPGSIVDNTVTMPERYDFYLVSQSVRQGTVSPTSYNVIYDTLGLDPDKIQRLTYKLTHLYFNWSGTVRVPAPVQYAHKLAYLVGQAIHKTPNTGLDDLLYFL